MANRSSANRAGGAHLFELVLVFLALLASALSRLPVAHAAHLLPLARLGLSLRGLELGHKEARIT